MTPPPAIDPAGTRAVDDAIATRRSVRAFLPTPVDRATIAQILEVASRAPSGTNTQPWKVHVLTGAARRSLSERILAAYDDPALRAQHAEEYTTTRASGSRLTSTAGARSAGTCTGCWASAARTRTACTPSTAATTLSSTRPSA